MVDLPEVERTTLRQTTQPSPWESLFQLPQASVTQKLSENCNLPLLRLAECSTTEPQAAQQASVMDAHVQSYRSHVQANIRDLGHRVFHTRDNAQRAFENQGLSSLVPLSRAQNSPDSEVSRRAQNAIQNILQRATAQELLACRTDSHAQSIARAQLGSITESELALFNRHIDAELLARWNREPYRNCSIFMKKDLGDPAPIIGQDLVQQLEHLNTVQGQAEISARMRELEQYLGSGNLAEHERGDLTRQMARMRILTQPYDLSNARIQARIQYGNSGHVPDLEQFALDTYATCSNEAQRRNVIYELVCWQSLDASPAWMRRFEAVDTVPNGQRSGRQMIADWHSRQGMKKD